MAEGRRRGRLLCPLQRAFFQFVDQSGDEQEDEKEDRKEDRKILGKEIPVDQGPWNQEDDLNIKEDEEHGRQVKLHVKAGDGFIFRREPTFVGGVLEAVTRASLGKQVAGNQDGDPKEYRQAQLNKDRNVIR